MRPNARLGLVLVVFFAFDVMIAKLEPQKFIHTSHRALVGQCGIVASLFLVPAIFILLPPRIILARSVRERVFYAVLVAWFLQVQFWAALVSPVHSQLKFERGDLADGFVSTFGIHITASFSSLLLTLTYIALRSRLVAPLKTTDTKAPMN
jgi:hypothetical protein